MIGRRLSVSEDFFIQILYRGGLCPLDSTGRLPPIPPKSPEEPFPNSWMRAVTATRLAATLAPPPALQLRVDRCKSLVTRSLTYDDRIATPDAACRCPLSRTRHNSATCINENRATKWDIINYGRLLAVAAGSRDTRTTAISCCLLTYTLHTRKYY